MPRRTWPARFSSDGGKTWTDEDTLILPNEGKMNIMSVSLLRLQDGRIAMFYLVKNSPRDCRPYMRISSDECKTWGDRAEIIPKVGYNVLNNDRVVQLETGRIVVPVAISNILRCYLSDDNGKTWRRGKQEVIGVDSDGERYIIQEPGLVPLKDGRLLMHCRTDQGCHYFTYSGDDGETWSKLEPSTLVGPRTAAAIKRIPTTGDLLCLWNFGPEDKRSADMEYTIAVSKDEGKTWKKIYVSRRSKRTVQALLLLLRHPVRRRLRSPGALQRPLGEERPRSAANHPIPDPLALRIQIAERPSTHLSRSSCRMCC